MKKITLKDVAAESGFSFSLVSKVLRDKGVDGIPAETRGLIRDCAARLGYIANKNARSLKTGRTDMIAVVGTVGQNYAATVYPIITEAIVEVFADGDGSRDIAFFNTLGGYREYENLQRIIALNPDAILYLVPPKSTVGLSADVDRQRLLRDYAGAGHPLMFVMERYEIPDSCVYAFDEVAGGYAGTDYLISSGRRRILFYRSDFGQRAEGYERRMAESGLDPLIMPGRYGYAFGEGYEAFNKLYLGSGQKELPDAIFATCDVFAAGICRAMRELGVPDGKIAVMGYDGLEISSLLGYRFATVLQPVRRIASEAAAALTAWLDTGTAPKPKLFGPEIITLG